MSFAENLAPFFAEFGDDGTLAGSPVRVLYDSPYIEAGLGSAGMSAREPSVRIKSVSVPGSIFGATLVIPQGTFKVRESQPDGTGITTLLLSAA
jgi:hypothetical protein